MTHNDFSQLSLRGYLDSFSEFVGTKSSYHADLKRVGRESQRIIFPNGCSITCSYKELIDIAREYSLPLSPSDMTKLLLEEPLNGPIDFFRSRVIVLAIISGFGIVRVEFPDSRSFIGKVEICYRGQLRKIS